MDKVNIGKLRGLRHMCQPPLRASQTDEAWNAHLDEFVGELGKLRAEEAPPAEADPEPPKKKKQGKTREHTGGEVREDSE